MRVNSSPSQTIQGTQTEGLKKSEQTSKTDRSRAAEKFARTQETGSSSAKAEISDRGKEFAKAHAVASASPDIREDRIAELKRRIASGEYKVDAEKVAEKMMSEHSAL